MYDLSKQFHIYQRISFDSLTHLKLRNIPSEALNGKIYDISGRSFATLLYYTVLFEGGHGILTKALWNTKPAIVKKPKYSVDLGNEALCQWLARETLKGYGVETAIPEVYGIFHNLQKQTCFSMEYISGCFPHKLLQETTNKDECFLQILSQVCVILYLLEKDINLDHRDLKLNNLYIRPRPVSYSLRIEERTFTIESPFQVCLLDFGFACLGSRINLSPENFSDKDPCPKEGRDLFHLLVSFWSIETLRRLLSEDLQKRVDGWLSPQFTHMAKKFNDIHWTYLVTSEKQFTHVGLTPAALLLKIHEI